MKTIEKDHTETEKEEHRKLKLNTGIPEKERREIAKGLGKLLADSYCLMLMTQNYHWNVRGVHFRSIHLLTEEHYKELFEAVDLIAERIRALGEPAPGTMKAFNDITSIRVPDATLSEEEMVTDLLEAHEEVAKTARGIFKLASDARDEVTADLLTQRMNHHEKNAWMLRSMIEW